MRRLAFLLPFLATLVLAHAEPVQAVVTLHQSENALEVEVALVGETSTLPIRGAVLELILARPSDRLLGLMKDGVLSRTGDAKLPAEEVARVPLKETKPGTYATRLSPPPPPGEYVLVLLDTTFKGEATMTGKLVRLPLEESPTIFTGVLPETKTPSRYLFYALAGLAVPALIGLVFALLARSERRGGEHGSGA